MVLASVRGLIISTFRSIRCCVMLRRSSDSVQLGSQRPNT